MVSYCLDAYLTCSISLVYVELLAIILPIEKIIAVAVPTKQNAY